MILYVCSEKWIYSNNFEYVLIHMDMDEYGVDFFQWNEVQSKHCKNGPSRCRLVSWRLHDFLFPHVQHAVSGISMSVSQFLWQKIQYFLQKQHFQELSLDWMIFPYFHTNNQFSFNPNRLTKPQTSTNHP